MKTAIISGILIPAIIIGSCAGSAKYGQFTTERCPVPISEELAASGNFQFGYITVPEFHGQKRGQSIELAVAVFKCRQDSTLHAPLVLNSGGPGMSNLEDFVPTFDSPLGNLFLNERDVVIIELRGLKHSRPSLHTPELEALQVELLDQHLQTEELLQVYLDTIASIRSRFEADGIDLSAYNYWETASDIVFVMESLGYDKFSAFGNSAGSFLAQYLLMDHADHLESLVLNAIPDLEPGFNNMCLTSIAKLVEILDKVDQDPEYSEVYPDLKDRFLLTLEELNQAPDTLRVQFRGQEGTSDLVLNGDRAAAWLFSHMYWGTQLPLSMHRIANRDFTEIIHDPNIFLPLPNYSIGSFWSMALNGWSDPTPDQLLEGTEWEPFVQGMSTMVFGQPFLSRVRETLGVEFQPGHIKPMATHVPVLMLNGGEDHVCLPGHVRELAEYFTNSYCYIFEGIAHSPIDAGPCGIMMMKQFLDNPGEAPDATCMEEFSADQAFVLP